MQSIAKEELLSRLASGEVVLVNVLAAPAFLKIRIKGSISIPRFELEGGRWRELDRAKKVVVYCSSYECAASKAAAEFLEAKGYDVSAYEGGVKEWAESGLPMEGVISPEQYLRERYGRPGQVPSSGR